MTIIEDGYVTSVLAKLSTIREAQDVVPLHDSPTQVPEVVLHDWPTQLQEVSPPTTYVGVRKEDLYSCVGQSCNSPIGVALAASVDKKISTEALRVYVGIHDLVVTMLSRKDADRAFVSHRDIEILSGVKHDTFTQDGHLSDLYRLGIDRISKGTKGRMRDGHGLASSWDFVPSDFTPIPANPLLAKFLDPSASVWSQAKVGSSGWRLALVLIALFGLEATTFNASRLADEVMEVNRSTTTRALQRLALTNLVERQDEGWMYWPLSLAHCLDQGGGPLLDLSPHEGRQDRLRGEEKDWHEKRPDAVAKLKNTAALTRALGRNTNHSSAMSPGVDHPVVAVGST